MECHCQTLGSTAAEAKCGIMELNAGNKREGLLQETSSSRFHAEIEGFARFFDTIKSLLDCACIVLIISTFSLVSDLSCDQPLVLWLSVVAGVDTVAVLFRWKASQPFAFSCFRFLRRVFEAVWISLGAVKLSDTVSCSGDLVAVTAVCLAAYCGKLSLQCCYCGSCVATSYRTAQDNAIRPMAEVSTRQDRIQQLPETPWEQPESHCLICYKAILPAASVIVLHCAEDHVFHPQCLRTFLRLSSVCPQCMRVV